MALLCILDYGNHILSSISQITIIIIWNYKEAKEDTLVSSSVHEGERETRERIFLISSTALSSPLASILVEHRLTRFEGGFKIRDGLLHVVKFVPLGMHILSTLIITLMLASFPFLYFPFVCFFSFLFLFLLFLYLSCSHFQNWGICIGTRENQNYIVKLHKRIKRNYRFKLLLVIISYQNTLQYIFLFVLRVL